MNQKNAECKRELELMLDDFECREANEKHSGDCTNECHTCMKCLWLDYIKATTHALTLIDKNEELEKEMKEVEEVLLAVNKRMYDRVIEIEKLQSQNKKLEDDYLVTVGMLKGSRKIVRDLQSQLSALREKVDGEVINNQLKILLPKDKLSKFERNFVAYKLAEYLNNHIGGEGRCINTNL